MKNTQNLLIVSFYQVIFNRSFIHIFKNYLFNKIIMIKEFLFRKNHEKLKVFKNF